MQGFPDSNLLASPFKIVVANANNENDAFCCLQYLENLYPCRTRDPEAAAAFYVPLYPGLLWLFYTHTECFPQQCSEPPPFVRLESELRNVLRRLPYLER